MDRSIVCECNGRVEMIMIFLVLIQATVLGAIAYYGYNKFKAKNDSDENNIDQTRSRRSSRRL